MGKLKFYIEIVRPVNLIITFLVVYVSGIICIGDIFFSMILILAGFTAALTAAGGNVINDIYDYKVDRINRPLRPLPLGKILKSEATIFYIILVCSSIISSFFISLTALFIVLFINLILYF